MTKERVVKVLSAPAAAKTTKKPTSSKPAPTKKPVAQAPAKPAPIVNSGRASASRVKPAPTKAVPTRPAKASPPPAPVPAPAAPKAKAPPKPVVPLKPVPPPVASPNSKTATASKSSGRTASKVSESAIPSEKDLSSKNAKGGVVKDRIFLMVPDPYWLHVHWELSYQSVQRAEASLGQYWHGAKPIIRLFDVTSHDTTSTSEAAVRDILVHGGCSHWYIDVPQPPRSYRADIGYLSARGDFRVLARSNVVTPPKAGVSEVLEENWAANIDETQAERILAMSTGFETPTGPPQLRELFDEQIKRSPKDNVFGSGAVLPDKLKKFAFSIDAELIVYGKTDPTARVTLQNEPVKVRGDGTFTMRYTLTDGRQIIPAVATASDGMEERTIVLAIERNTKHLDPMVHDLYAEQ